MSQEEKDKAAEKGSHISRRAFLKDAGWVVSAPALGSIALSTEAAAQAKTGPAANAAPAPAAVPAQELIVVELTVNGGKYRHAVEPHWTLRQLLRDQIGFTSPKDWCGGQGACGSCTVIVNGRPVLSCLTLACECQGAVVETAEGIAK